MPNRMAAIAPVGPDCTTLNVTDCIAAPRDPSWQAKRGIYPYLQPSNTTYTVVYQISRAKFTPGCHQGSAMWTAYTSRSNFEDLVARPRKGGNGDDE